MLSLENESGKFYGKANYLLKYGLVAVLLFELVMNKKVQLQGKEFVLIDDSSSGDIFQDKVYEILKRVKDLDLYIKFSSIVGIAMIRETINSLINRGIVKDECKKFLRFIPADRYPVTNEQEKRKVESEIANVLIDEKTDDYSSVFMSSIVVA